MTDPVGATFAALADPSRRRMLSLMGGSGATATEHLSQLASAGLVAPTRQGRETRYRITPEPLEDAVAWIVQAGGEWDDRLARLGAYVRDDRTA